FTQLEPIRKTDGAREQWSSKLGIPDAFWSDTSARLNGYFGCSTDPYNKSRPLMRYETTFRLIVKRLDPKSGPKEYRWLEMSFFFKWTKSSSLFVCFDAPEEFPQKFEAALQARFGGASKIILEPYALHVVLMELSVPIYDQSVWDLSKRVRTIEKNREYMTDTDFPGLHEVARHTAHATETVQVACNVLERMAVECEALAQRQSDDTEEQEMFERLEALKYQHSMMLGVAARSTSNEKRLSNEINLVFNMMAQKDNDVNIDIARATRADSVAMKTIAVVTLTFLPATYVSALLGMNLFAYNPETNGGHISSSPDLWIYFVISIPLTAAVLTLWWVWQRREEMFENPAGKVVMSTGSKTPSLRSG
ncbi:hypothetical protein E4T48_01305, partial [Aureobasidium sp. EXF-10727]